MAADSTDYFAGIPIPGQAEGLGPGWAAPANPDDQLLEEFENYQFQDAMRVAQHYDQTGSELFESFLHRHEHDFDDGLMNRLTVVFRQLRAATSEGLAGNSGEAAEVKRSVIQQLLPELKRVLAHRVRAKAARKKEVSVLAEGMSAQLKEHRDEERYFAGMERIKRYDSAPLRIGAHYVADPAEYKGHEARDAMPERPWAREGHGEVQRAIVMGEGGREGVRRAYDVSRVSGKQLPSKIEVIERKIHQRLVRQPRLLVSQGADREEPRALSAGTGKERNTRSEEG